MSKMHSKKKAAPAKSKSEPDGDEGGAAAPALFASASARKPPAKKGPGKPAKAMGGLRRGY